MDKAYQRDLGQPYSSPSPTCRKKWKKPNIAHYLSTAPPSVPYEAEALQDTALNSPGCSE